MSSLDARVIVTQTALDDMSGILLSLEKEAAPDQRMVYASEIEAVRDLLQMMPSNGLSRDDVYPGLRSVPVGNHLLYYTYSDDVVSIRRVRHSRRDPHTVAWDDLGSEPFALSDE